MIKMSEEHQRKETETRERARRVSTIHERIVKEDAWKAAMEIEELQRRVLELTAGAT